MLTCCPAPKQQADTGNAALIREQDGELSTPLQHTACSPFSSIQGESESEQDSSPLERLQIRGSNPETNCFVVREKKKQKKTTLGRIPIQKPEETTLLESSLIHDLCPTKHCMMPARKRCLTLQFGSIPQVILFSKEYLLFFSPPNAFVLTIKVSSFCSVLFPVTKHQNIS